MKKFFLITLILFFQNFSLCCSGYFCPKLYILNKKTCLCDPERETFLCRRSCKTGLVITPFCECKTPSFCPAIPCPEGTIKDPSDCVCYPLRSIKPLSLCSLSCNSDQNLDPLTCTCNDEPILCDIECNFGYKVTKECECKPIFDLKKCGIRRCKRGHRIDQEVCECVEKNGPICEIGCPFGRKVYPGICSCIREIKCPIRRCKKGYRKSRKDCKCIGRK